MRLRLLSVTAAAVAGAALLLGGGLAARAAVEDEGQPALTRPQLPESAAEQEGPIDEPGQQQEPTATTGQPDGDRQDPEAGLPDLAVTLAPQELTVSNLSGVDAGAFSVLVTMTGGEQSLRFDALAADTQESRPLSCPPGATVSALVDANGEIEEGNEGNNSAQFTCPKRPEPTPDGPPTAPGDTTTAPGDGAPVE